MSKTTEKIADAMSSALTGKSAKAKPHEYKGASASGTPIDTEKFAASSPLLSGSVEIENTPASPELQRRKNNMARDRRTGFKVTRNSAYATPEKG